MDITLQKVLVLMLAADRHQLLGQRLQLCQGSQIAVDVGPAATTTLYYPPQHKFVADRKTGLDKSLTDFILS